MMQKLFIQLTREKIWTGVVLAAMRYGAFVYFLTFYDAGTL